MKKFITLWNNWIKSWMSSFSTFSKVNMGVYGKYFPVDYMPEPYLGNPNNSSFVIINLNPGRGCCHSWHYLQSVSDTLINRVKTKTYSNIAFSFPYLRNQRSIKLKNWELNGGRIWWKSKIDWINYIYCAAGLDCNIDDIKPFAIELCAWHSPSWKLDTKKLCSGSLPSCIFYNCIIDIICQAIDKSKLKFGYCVGKAIGDVLCCHGFSDVTSSIGCSSRPITSINRSYRVLRDQHNRYVINTWAQGSNRYPAKNFWPEEKIIINAIYKHLKISVHPSTHCSTKNTHP